MQNKRNTVKPVWRGPFDGSS